MSIRRNGHGSDLAFVLWFAFIAVVNLAFLGALIWLIIQAAEWIGRQ